MKLTGKKSFEFKYFQLIFVLNLIVPSFHSILDSAGILIIHLIIVLFTLQILNKYYGNKILLNGKTLTIFLVLMIIFFFQIIFSIIISSIKSDGIIFLRDTYELYRPISYFSSFLLGYLVSKSNNFHFKLDRLMLIMLSILLIFSLIDLFDLYNPFLELYSKTANINSSRVSAPFVNPYDFAFNAFCLNIFFSIRFFFKRNLSSLLLLFISFFLLLIPQSRSVLVASMFAYIFVFPIVLISYNNYNARGKLGYPLLAYIVSLVFLIFLAVSIFTELKREFPYLIDQIILFFQNGDVGNSGSIRIKQIMFALEKSSKNLIIILFGNGPSKLEMEYVESMYAYQFFRYGIFGFILYTFTPITLFIKCTIKNIKCNNLQFEKVHFNITFLLFLISLPVLFIGNNFTEQVRSSFIFYSFAGIICSQYDSLKLSKG